VKNLFITSTRHNEGKTLVTMGLTPMLSKRVRGVGYMKQVGKGSVEFAGRLMWGKCSSCGRQLKLRHKKLPRHTDRHPDVKCRGSGAPQELVSTGGYITDKFLHMEFVPAADLEVAA